ncbi:MAG: short-chain dehydrogenase [Pseudomonadales bacterium]|nr:short-chain dehydrogenase [Pseudomonadales bacterium]
MAPAQNHALVIGAGSALAGALVQRLLEQQRVAQVLAVSRQPAPAALPPAVQWHQSDYDEPSMDGLIRQWRPLAGRFRYGFIFNGRLHDGELQPEKKLEDISVPQLQALFHSNTIIPALWLSRLRPLLKGGEHCVLTLLSARIGSISDNHLGGWYGYRMSKAALNMLVQTAGIEYQRRAANVSLLAYHPGTTDTPLSRPFQSRVPQHKLFSAEQSAEYLLQQVSRVTPEHQVLFRDWQGQDIPW